jgi:pyridoxal phosphate-dependent aminotransferase EpsN
MSSGGVGPNAGVGILVHPTLATISDPLLYAALAGAVIAVVFAVSRRSHSFKFLSIGPDFQRPFWRFAIEDCGATTIAAERVASRARIYLSPPHIGPAEKRFVEEAFEGNWIAPVGPNLDAFEREMCEASGAKHALCLSSGTAALHLAVRLAGVGRGDEVFCSTFTFAASAGPILYEGGHPVFIDSEPGSWNMDPILLAEALESRARAGRLPKAVIVVDLYGQCARWDEIMALCSRYGVPIIEDAAEAVGSTYKGRWAGLFGTYGVYSFNGNKILTTSGGGMLLSDDAGVIEHAKKLATQARDPAPHYQHSELGFNYRMSNVLAGIGRGQLRSLPRRMARRREILGEYVKALGDLEGVSFMPELPEGRSNLWLSCMTIDPSKSQVTPERVLAALARDDIEGRPLWKPLHLQPFYGSAQRFGGSVSESLFARGLCLPSGSAMTDADVARVVDAVRGAFGAE